METGQIIEYIRSLQAAEALFKGRSAPTAPLKTSRLHQLGFILFSLADTVRLLVLKRRFNQQPLVYTAPIFFQNKDGRLSDRITGAVLTGNIVYINHSKTQRLRMAGVFHTGGVVFLLGKLFFKKHDPFIRYFLAYRWLNNLILKHRSGPVYTLCFYDMNGLSLVFSKHRSKFDLCEIQHGNMINYPPYTMPAPVKIADQFFVRNAATATFLRHHLCKNFEATYQLIPYPAVARVAKPGIHLFYASTIEFEGFHPAFQAFMAQIAPESYTLTVRLHPREKGREALFLNNPWKKDLHFDQSFNWLENLKIANTVVISPWSSCLEEAVDNQLTAIIIDPVGRLRYEHLIDGVRCIYSDNLLKTIPEVCQVNHR